MVTYNASGGILAGFISMKEMTGLLHVSGVFPYIFHNSLILRRATLLVRELEGIPFHGVWSMGIPGF